MSHSSRYWFGLTAILFSACGGNGANESGVGGSTGSGGMVSSTGGVTAGSGGVIALGGAAGSGASGSGSGGTTGAGGSSASGPDGGSAAPDSGNLDALIGPRCEGDHWVSSAMDVAKIDSCAVIGGNLSVTGNRLLDVGLPKLTNVEGFLTVWGNPALAQMSLPAIEEIGGYLDVSSNAQLASLSIPALRTVNQRRLAKPQDVLFSDNPLLDCQAEAIAAQLRAKGFTGSIRIEPENLACSR